MATGTFTGVLLALALKLEIQGFLKDGSLGSLGFLLGFVAAVLMPWPQNTTTYYVGTTLVTSTMKSYQCPERVGIAAAILLPLLRELYCFKRSKSRHIGYN